MHNENGNITYKTIYGEEISNLSIGLLGLHQLNNAAVAIKVLQYLNTFSTFEIGLAAIKKAWKSILARKNGENHFKSIYYAGWSA